MALATLGLFVFSLPTIPLQDWDEGHAWRHPSQTTVGGSGQPPRVPFVAAALENRNITINDLDAIGAIADFERCLAWAWLGSH